MKGKRISVCYPGQVKQCQNCFIQGHVYKECQDQVKGNWLDFVARLVKSNLWEEDLFGTWIDTLKRLHPEFNRPDPQDLRQQINYNRAGVPRGDLRRNIGFSSIADSRNRIGWNPEFYQDQPGQNNWARGRGRGRGQRYRGYQGRGRGQANRQNHYYPQEYPQY